MTMTGIKNPEKQEQEKNNFKKNIIDKSLNKIISIDETSIDTHIWSNYGSSMKGKEVTKIHKKK